MWQARDAALPLLSPGPGLGAPGGQTADGPAPPSPPPQPQTCPSLPVTLACGWAGQWAPRLSDSWAGSDVPAAPQGLLSTSQSYPSHKCILLRNQQSNLWSRNEEAPDTSTQHRLPPVTRPFSQVPPEMGLGAPSSLFSSMHLHTHNTHTHTTHTYTLHTCHTYYTQHTRYAHHTYTTHPEFVYFINSTRPPIHFISQHVSVFLVRMSCNLVNQSSMEYAGWIASDGEPRLMPDHLESHLTIILPPGSCGASSLCVSQLLHPYNGDKKST